MRAQYVVNDDYKAHSTWKRHQTESLSASLALYEGNPPDIYGFPQERHVTRSFGIVFDRRLANGWAIETPVIWDVIVLIVTLQ